MSSHWNIRLFHYRNHDPAFGRVLMGIKASKTARKVFQTFLDKIGFACQD